MQIETVVIFDNDNQTVSKFKHKLKIIDLDTNQEYCIPYSSEVGGVLKSMVNSFNGDFPIDGITLNNTSKKKLKALINQIKNQ